MSLPCVNLLHLTEFKSPEKILKLMINTTRSKVKSRSHHDVAHLQPQSMSLPRIYLLHFTVSEKKPGQDFIGQGHYGRVKSQIKVTLQCCTPTPLNKCPYKDTTSYTLRLQRYSPGQDFQTQGPYGKVKGQIKVTP